MIIINIIIIYLSNENLNDITCFFCCVSKTAFELQVLMPNSDLLKVTDFFFDDQLTSSKSDTYPISEFKQYAWQNNPK